MSNAKNKRMLLLIPVIVFAVYSLVMLLAVQQKGGLFWTAWGFTFLSFAVGTGVLSWTMTREDITLKDIFLGLPLNVLTLWYMVIQLLLSVVVVLIPDMAFKIALILQIVMLAVYLILAISAVVGKNVVEATEQKQTDTISAHRELCGIASRLVNRATDATVKAALTKVYEAIQYSDPVSSPSVKALDDEITSKLYALQNTLGVGDATGYCEKCHELELLIVERNEKNKAKKQVNT